MITPEMVADKIADILAAEYPSSTIYLHSIPADAGRPSFNIYMDADRSETDSLTLTNETLSMGIVYYEPQDGTEPEGLKPFAVYSNIKEIFRKGHIQVGDRSLKVVLIRGGCKDGNIFLIAKLVYYEIRPQEETDFETVGEISIATNYGREAIL